MKIEAEAIVERPVDVVWAFIFERTRLRRVIEPSLSGRWRLLWPLFLWSAGAGRDEEVIAVKRILEAGDR